MEVRMIRELIKSAVHLLKPNCNSLHTISAKSIQIPSKYEIINSGRKSHAIEGKKTKIISVKSNGGKLSAYKAKFEIKPKNPSAVRLRATNQSQSDNDNLSDLEVPSETKSH